MNRRDDKSTYIILALLSLAVVWIALVIAGCYENGINVFDLFERVASALNQPFNISVNQYSIKFVFALLFAYAMGIGIYFTSRENRRPGEEHGSAKWGQCVKCRKEVRG